MPEVKSTIWTSQVISNIIYIIIIQGAVEPKHSYVGPFLKCVHFRGYVTVFTIQYDEYAARYDKVEETTYTSRAENYRGS